MVYVVGSHGTHDLTRAPIIKLKKKKKGWIGRKEQPAGPTRRWAGILRLVLQPPPQCLGPTSSSGSPFSWLKTNRFDIKKQRSQQISGRDGEKLQLSCFIIKNRLIKFETEYKDFFFCFIWGYFCGVFLFFSFFFPFFFFFLFTPVWWSHQQTSNKDMPTMFTIQYSHGYTLPTARWVPPLNEETITPFRR